MFLGLPTTSSDPITEAADLPTISSDPITEAMKFAIRVTKDSITCENNTGSDSESMKEDLNSEADFEIITEPNFGRAEGNAEEPNFGRVEGNVGESNFGRAEGNAEEPNYGRADDSGTEEDMLSTPEGIPRTPEPELDTFSLIEEAIEDYDYSMEIFDWENFQQDLDSVENMNFYQFLA